MSTKKIPFENEISGIKAVPEYLEFPLHGFPETKKQADVKNWTGVAER